VIAERERQGHVSETKFVGIERAEIIEAHLTDGTAEVTVRFLSHLITATLDRNGVVVDGDANRVTDVTDIWRFARNVRSNDPNWRLVATANG
jgi:predicted lipid-binding transport protein (Tim44 family)